MPQLRSKSTLWLIRNLISPTLARFPSQMLRLRILPSPLGCRLSSKADTSTLLLEKNHRSLIPQSRRPRWRRSNFPWGLPSSLGLSPSSQRLLFASKKIERASCQCIFIFIYHVLLTAPSLLPLFVDDPPHDPMSHIFLRPLMFSPLVYIASSTFCEDIVLLFLSRD